MERIYVIIPAWNEAKRLRKTLESLAPFNYHLVVVDDGSTDDTYQIAKAHKDAIVLRHYINRGQGAALDTGMQYAIRQQADYIVHFDADGQFQAGEIAEVLAPLKNDPTLDIVLGSRYKGHKQVNVPLFKQLFIHKPALLFQNLTTGLKLTDVHSGFRALTLRAARQIEIKQDAMAHASEIVSQIKSKHLNYTEVPISVLYNEYGQGFMKGFKIFGDLFIRKILK